ncbi:MAG: hypothetical protein KKC19_02805 [Nanoarchaeota archaeon]|nr:hypothetical protein [Nanoarchaeota archaeon]
MNGKLQLRVTNHAVDRYRQRVEKDMWRELRSEGQIVKILRDGIALSVEPSDVDGMPSEKPSKVAVNLSCEDEDFGFYEITLVRRRNKGRRYLSVITVYDWENQAV